MSPPLLLTFILRQGGHLWPLFFFYKKTCSISKKVYIFASKPKYNIVSEKRGGARKNAGRKKRDYAVRKYDRWVPIDLYQSIKDKVNTLIEEWKVNRQA